MAEHSATPEDRREAPASTVSVTTFCTCNARGDHHFPVQRTEFCGTCGALIASSYVKPEKVALHIIGETELTDEERQEIANEVRRKVRVSRAGYGYWSGTSYAPGSALRIYEHQELQDAAAGAGESVKLTLGDRTLAVIPYDTFRKLASSTHLGEWLKGGRR